MSNFLFLSNAGADYSCHYLYNIKQGNTAADLLKRVFDSLSVQQQMDNDTDDFLYIFEQANTGLVESMSHHNASQMSIFAADYKGSTITYFDVIRKNVIVRNGNNEETYFSNVAEFINSELSNGERFALHNPDLKNLYKGNDYYDSMIDTASFPIILSGKNVIDYTQEIISKIESELAIDLTGLLDAQKTFKSKEVRFYCNLVRTFFNSFLNSEFSDEFNTADNRKKFELLKSQMQEINAGE